MFDICCSTAVLRDLKDTDNLSRWRNLLINIKNWMAAERSKAGFEVYKFVGDGWILLFGEGATKQIVFDTMHRLCGVYQAEYAGIAEVLQHPPDTVGLTFGVDEGLLTELEMDGEQEFIGRAINVAARLQSATKQSGGGRRNKAFISKNAYGALKGDLSSANRGR